MMKIFNLLIKVVGGALAGFGIGFVLAGVVCIVAGSGASDFVFVLSTILGAGIGAYSYFKEENDTQSRNERDSMERLQKEFGNKVRAVLKLSPEKRNWQEVERLLSASYIVSPSMVYVCNSRDGVKWVKDIWLDDLRKSVQLLRDYSAGSVSAAKKLVTQFLTTNEYKERANIWLEALDRIPNEKIANMCIVPLECDINQFIAQLEEVFSLDIDVDTVLKKYDPSGEISDEMLIKGVDIPTYLNSYTFVGREPDFEILAKLLWYSAVKLNETSYNKVLKVYRENFDLVANNKRNELVRIMSPDAFITQSYVYLKVSKDLLRNMHNEMKLWQDKYSLSSDIENIVRFAHGLRIVGAYEEEKMILQEAFAKKLPLESTQIERLSYLNKGGVRNSLSLPEENNLSIDKFYCNYSSAKWGEDEARAFLESYLVNSRNANVSLLFQEQTLPYNKLDFSFEWDIDSFCSYMDAEMKSVYGSEIKCIAKDVYSLADNFQKMILIKSFQTGDAVIDNCVVCLIHGGNEGKKLVIQLMLAYNIKNAVAILADKELVLNEFLSVQKEQNAQIKFKIDTIKQMILKLADEKVRSSETNDLY